MPQGENCGDSVTTRTPARISIIPTTESTVSKSFTLDAQLQNHEGSDDCNRCQAPTSCESKHNSCPDTDINATGHSIKMESYIVDMSAHNGLRGVCALWVVLAHCVTNYVKMNGKCHTDPK